MTTEPYPGGAGMRAADRKCSNDKAHPMRSPRYIDSRTWDFTVAKYGKPLCRDCQPGGAPHGR